MGRDRSGPKRAFSLDIFYSFNGRGESLVEEMSPAAHRRSLERKFERDGGLSPIEVSSSPQTTDSDGRGESAQEFYSQATERLETECLEAEKIEAKHLSAERREAEGLEVERLENEREKRNGRKRSVRR